MSALETARPAADSSEGTRALWLSSGQPPASLVACLRAAHVALDVQARRGSEPPPRVVWVARAPATASDRPNLSDIRIGVLHTDAGAADGLAQALRGAGAQVVLVSDSTESLKRMQMLEPDVLVVAQADLPGVLRGPLAGVWRHPILRWTPVLVCREALFGHAGMHAPELRHLAHTLMQVTRAAQQIVRTLESAQRLVFPLTKLGPARPLSSLVATGLGLRVLLESPDLHVEVDLAEGIVAGAQGTRRGEPKGALLGARALAEMIHATTGTLRVRKVARPAQTNVMAPLEAALIAALADHPEPQPDDPSHVSGTKRSSVAPSRQSPHAGGEGESPLTTPRMPPPSSRAAGLPSLSGEARVGVRKVVPVTPSGRPRERVGEPVHPRRTLSGVASGKKSANEMAPSAPRALSPQRAGRTLLGVSAPSPPRRRSLASQAPAQASSPAGASERPEANTVPVKDDELLEALASQLEAGSPLASTPERPDAGSEGAWPVPPGRGAMDKGSGAVTQTVDAVAVCPAGSEPVPGGGASEPVPGGGASEPVPGGASGPVSWRRAQPLAAARRAPGAARPPAMRVPVPGWVYVLSATLVLGALALAVWILRDDRARLLAALREGDLLALSPFAAGDPRETIEPPAAQSSAGQPPGGGVEGEATQEAAQGASQRMEEGASPTASGEPSAGEGPEVPAPRSETAEESLEPAAPGADPTEEPPANARNQAAEEGASVEREKPYPRRRVPRGLAMLADADASLQAGRPQQASDLYERAAELIPRHAPVHVGLARAYLRMERHEDALEAAKRVVAMEPRNGTYRILLGDAFAALGMDERADTQWRKAYRRGAKREATERLKR